MPLCILQMRIHIAPNKEAFRYARLMLGVHMASIRPAHFALNCASETASAVLECSRAETLAWVKKSWPFGVPLYRGTQRDGTALTTDAHII